jgi:hypothetical protein
VTISTLLSGLGCSVPTSSSHWMIDDEACRWLGKQVRGGKPYELAQTSCLNRPEFHKVSLQDSRGGSSSWTSSPPRDAPTMGPRSVEEGRQARQPTESSQVHAIPGNSRIRGVGLIPTVSRRKHSSLNSISRGYG